MQIHKLQKKKNASFYIAQFRKSEKYAIKTQGGFVLICPQLFTF